MKLMKALLFLAVSVCAYGAETRLTFSSRSALDCPVLIVSSTESKDYGYQTITIRNDGRNKISAVNLRVALIDEEGAEQVFDAAGVPVDLVPDERKSVEVGMARIEKLQELAAKENRSWIRAVMYAEVVYFADGTMWDEYSQRRKYDAERN